jgi:hypothetical protein
MKRAYPYELVAKISPSEDWLRLCDEVRIYFKESKIL